MTALDAIGKLWSSPLALDYADQPIILHNGGELSRRQSTTVLTAALADLSGELNGAETVEDICAACECGAAQLDDDTISCDQLERRIVELLPHATFQHLYGPDPSEN